MPLYEFHHSNPLSTSQQDALAAAVTKIHTEKFTTPSLFVNVRFHHFDESGSAGGGGYYVGGKRVSSFPHLCLSSSIQVKWLFDSAISGLLRYFRA